MEPQKLTLKPKKKTGKIVIVTLAAALAIALGFIVWQNCIYQEPKVAEDSKTTTSSSTDSDKGTKDEPVIPDMIDYAAGIKVTTQADLAKLTNSPETLKAYLYGNIEKANQMAEMDGCTTAITVKKVYKQMYATGGVNVEGEGCGGGFAALWGNVDGSWKQLAGSQANAFGCTDLMKYKVPAAIAGDTCIDDSAPEGKPYTQS